jgi:hypothetical protein
MKRVVLVLLAGMALAGAAAAETPAQPKCQKAEINPVTGHVFCFEPLGAPVEALPEEAKPPCEEDSRGRWTWSPNCTPTPEGM